MKGKKFIAIMAIFIIICSVQAITALEDNNLTLTEIQIDEKATADSLEVSVVDASDNLTSVPQKEMVKEQSPKQQSNIINDDCL